MNLLKSNMEIIDIKEVTNLDIIGKYFDNSKH